MLANRVIPKPRSVPSLTDSIQYCFGADEGYGESRDSTLRTRPPLWLKWDNTQSTIYAFGWGCRSGFIPMK